MAKQFARCGSSKASRGPLFAGACRPLIDRFDQLSREMFEPDIAMATMAALPDDRFCYPELTQTQRVFCFSPEHRRGLPPGATRLPGLPPALETGPVAILLRFAKDFGLCER